MHILLLLNVPVTLSFQFLCEKRVHREGHMLSDCLMHETHNKDHFQALFSEEKT